MAGETGVTAAGAVGRRAVQAVSAARAEDAVARLAEEQLAARVVRALGYHLLACVPTFRSRMSRSLISNPLPLSISLSRLSLMEIE